MEATLEGEPVNFRIRINRHKQKKIAWKDILSHDYMQRPVGEKHEVVDELM